MEEDSREKTEKKLSTRRQFLSLAACAGVLAAVTPAAAMAASGNGGAAGSGSAAGSGMGPGGSGMGSGSGMGPGGNGGSGMGPGGSGMGSGEANMAAGAGGAASSAPSTAAIYVKDGAEDASAEDTDGVTIDGETGAADSDGTYVISDLTLDGTLYTSNGIVATGSKTTMRIEDSTITMDTTETTDGTETGGDGVIVDDGATLYLDGDTVTVKGAQRHVVAAYNDATLVVNDSTIESTGSVGTEDSAVTEPSSNAALLIYGIARANFSVGATKTYYYNSTCTAEGWGALSTDSATGDGLDLFAYNTSALAKDGGYGSYADTNCRLWMYGSKLASGEIGVIISKTGQLTADSGDNATDDALAYLADDGKTTTDQTVIAGLRNCVMMHAPDMMGEGAKAASTATLSLSNTLLSTDPKSEYLKDAKNAQDYADKYGDAIGAYIDYITGADLLLKSTSAIITLENVTMETAASDEALIKSVINSDSMSNYLLASDSDVDPIDITMSDMEAEGNIVHMDYQRTMNVTLGDGATLTGDIIGGDADTWNALWSDYADDETAYWILDDTKYLTTAHGANVTLASGSTWTVADESTIASLCVEKGATLTGTVTVDGKQITPESGTTYTGQIVIKKA